MTIRFDKVTIRVSELQTHTVEVAPWETPILQALYGEEAKVVGHVEVDRAKPGAADEFARLANRYGPKNSDTPVVAAVYGNFGPGVNALRDAINGRGSPAAEEGFTTQAELTEEEIDAVLAANEARQPAVIENLDPKPPIAGSNLVEVDGDGADDAVDGGEDSAFDPAFDGEDETFEKGRDDTVGLGSDIADLV